MRRPFGGRAWIAVTVVAASAMVVGACGSGGPKPSRGTSAPTTPTSPSPTGRTTSPSPTPSPTATPDAAQRLLATMSLQQMVGQLLMIGTPATGSASAVTTAVRDVGVGGVFLSGRSSAGADATARLTQGIRGLGGSVPVLIGTDQEGGQVQVLSGPGFDRMPSAVNQGRLDPPSLQADAARWGSQLAAAGVDVDLAPVLDTVPDGVSGSDNPPIAGYDREYGHDPATVSSRGGAFWQGMSSAGVATAGKHFPGLGRVSANTDSTRDVVDDVTTTDDPYLQPFTDAITAGIPMIMTSNATYAKIDPSQPAIFSPTVITGLLRQQLGFAGVVISDSIGAAAVSAVPLGDRAVRFIAAGGDLVLDTRSSDAPALANALVGAAQLSPGFRAQVEAAALRVLRLKARMGLI